MSWATLPNEILHKIFLLLDNDKATLIQLQLTCGDWGQVARELLYTDIDNIGWWDEETTGLLLRTLKSVGSSVAHSIKTVSAYEPASKEDILEIARLCPNLTSISSLTYSEMLTLFQQGYLQKLEEVDYPLEALASPESLASYTQLVFAAKKTIRKLYILKESRNALNKHLDDFTNLKELFIDYEEGISLMQLSDLFRNKTNIPRELHLGKVNSTKSTHSNLLSQAISMPQVKVLSIKLSDFSLNDLQLVKTMFPSLEKLSKSWSSDDASFLNNTLATSEERSQEIIGEYLAYLLCIKEIEGEKFAVSTEALLALVSDLAKHHRVAVINIKVHQFPNDRINTLDVWAAYSDGKDYVLNIGVNEQQLNKAFYQRLLAILEDFVNLSSLQLFSRDDASAPDGKLLGSFIDYILTRFSNLKVLGLLGIYLPSLPATNTLDKKLVLDLLLLEDCQVPVDFLFQMSQRISHISQLSVYNLKEYDDTFANPYMSKKINMPYTTFKELFLVRGDNEFLFKVNTNFSTFYYGSGASALDKAQYKKLVRNSDKGFDIQCVNLEMLKTLYDDMSLNEAK